MSLLLAPFIAGCASAGIALPDGQVATSGEIVETPYYFGIKPTKRTFMGFMADTPEAQKILATCSVGDTCKVIGSVDHSTEIPFLVKVSAVTLIRRHR
jgi:hypothetical protein